MVRLAKQLNGRKVDIKTYPKYLPFPRFTEEENIVAKKFIEEVNIDGEYWFDVRLTSTKARYVDNLPKPLQKMWEEVTAKRIDMVILTKNVVHIVEIKRYMLSSGIGQLLLYRDMFIDEYQPDSPVELWYAVYYWDPDVMKLCKKLGIKTWSYIK